MSLDDTGLAAFFAAGRQQQHKKNDVIVNLRDDPRSIFLITDGFVKACSYTANGSERIAHIYSVGEIFPVSSLIYELQHNVFFVAYSKTKLLCRDKQEVLAYFDENPRSVLQIVRQQAAIFNPMLNLHMDSAKQKVVYHLLHLAMRFGHQEGQFSKIMLPFTQQEFADSITMSRETAGRILCGLERDGHIVRGRQFTMVHTERLTNLGHELEQPTVET
jgi:CRP-like cAMP-binding protein